MNARRITVRLLLFALLAFTLSGCGLLFGGSEESAAEAAAEDRVLVPTFTATPPGQEPPATPTIVFAPAEPEVQAVLPVTATVPVTATTPVTATAPLTPTATPAPKARLFVEQELINVRTGPGTEYGLGGTATKGQEFDIIAKNQAGDWWQICCVNGEPVWVLNQLARVENTTNVPVAVNIAAPAAPVAAAPAPAQPAAPAPAEPTATPAPAAPPADNPCAGIGGDGCKFKVRGGPSFAPNGGSELKLTLAFIHSGIDGGQPQGSYFVVLLKDGQNVGVPDSVRSFDPSVGMRSGPSGQYNYEYKVTLDKINGSVAGNYTIWVLDGNGERDSQNFNFTVPEGQGEVWIQFDQA